MQSMSFYKQDEKWMGRKQQNCCFKVLFWLNNSAVRINSTSTYLRYFHMMKFHTPRNIGDCSVADVMALSTVYWDLFSYALCLWFFLNYLKLLLKNVFDNRQPYPGLSERISVKRNHFNFFLKHLAVMLLSGVFIAKFDTD